MREVFSYGKAEHARVLELQAKMRAEMARLEGLSAETDKAREALPESLARARESMESMEKKAREAEETLLAMRARMGNEEEAARVVQEVKKAMREESPAKKAV